MPGECTAGTRGHDVDEHALRSVLPQWQSPPTQQSLAQCNAILVAMLIDDGIQDNGPGCSPSVSGPAVVRDCDLPRQARFHVYAVAARISQRHTEMELNFVGHFFGIGPKQGYSATWMVKRVVLAAPMGDSLLDYLTNVRTINQYSAALGRNFHSRRNFAQTNGPRTNKTFIAVC